MIDRKKSQGGRLPAPRDAAECRGHIARETVNHGRERRLRWLYRLLKAFTAAEEAERQDRRLAAQAAANELKTAEIELKRSEYRRRFAAAPLGQRMLLTKIERLESELTALNADSNQKAGDCACQ